MRRWWLLGLVAVAGCKSGGDEPTDGGVVDSRIEECESAADCDDGQFCNGDETCDPRNADADAEGCVRGEPPCEGECVEASDECMTDCVDADGDGHGAESCGGDDCDDNDPDRFAGNTEVCDAEGHDEDCDPDTLGPDGDSDTYPAEECCQLESGGTLRCGRDCDDASAGINPGAPDGCGGGDEDCDLTIDEEPDAVWYRDQDGDDYGVMDDTVRACSQPAGYAPRAGDCKDDPFEDAEAADYNPGVVDVCDDEDNDCDGLTDEAFMCTCTMAGVTESCGIEEELNGVGPCRLGTWTCQSDGLWSECLGEIGPQDETCNQMDDDCDGVVDNGVEVTCWEDPDRDSYAAATAASISRCTCPDAYTSRDPSGANAADCQPSNGAIHPGAVELCDRLDSNCSRTGTDEPFEDFDSDRHSPPGAACTGGLPKDDCNDFNADVFAGQLRFFSSGFCPGTWCLCPPPAGVAGPSRCVDRGPLSCDLCTSNNTDPLPGFDYDCSGTEVRMPSAGGVSCPPCPSGFGCDGDERAGYGGSPACGTGSVTYWTCAGECSCSPSAVSTGPMKCH